MNKKKIIGVLFLIIFITCCSVHKNNLNNNTSLDLITPTPLSLETTISIQETLSPNTTQTVSDYSGFIKDDNQKWIGLIFPPMPNGISGGCSIILDFNQNRSGNDWCLGIVDSNNEYFVWLNHSVKNSDQIKWQVKDVLLLPKMSDSEYFLPYGCQIDGIDTPNLIAIVEENQEDKNLRFVDYKKMKMAWWINFEKQIIQTQQITPNMTCYIDGAILIDN